MIDFRHSAHAVYDIKYHIIWVTTYRYKVTLGAVAKCTRELYSEFDLFVFRWTSKALVRTKWETPRPLILIPS